MVESQPSEFHPALGSLISTLRGLRVLSIAPTSFFGDYGCHVRILEEARALKSLGHDVTILTYFKGNEVPGFRTIRTMPTPWHRDYEVGSSRHKFAFDILLGIRLARVLSRNSYDIIHAHLHEGALIGCMLAKLRRIPVCFDYQGSLTSEMLDHGFLRRETKVLTFWQRLEHAIERMPDATFTSTHNAYESLRRSLPADRQIVAVPDGVNIDVFRPDVLTREQRAARRAAFGLRSDETVVVFLGLLAKHQGIYSILDAAEIVKAQGHRVRWLIMGYPGVGLWRGIASERGLTDEVVFTDRVPYTNAPHMLALGDIAVAPKLSLTEGSGKILNYMAMGLPTVAFDTPAQIEYLGNLGVYAPVGDSRQLAARIVELAGQPDRRALLGQNLRTRARQQFGWDRVAQQINSVYQQLVAQRYDYAMIMKSDTTSSH